MEARSCDALEEEGKEGYIYIYIYVYIRLGCIFEQCKARDKATGELACWKVHHS